MAFLFNPGEKENDRINLQTFPDDLKSSVLLLTDRNNRIEELKILEESFSRYSGIILSGGGILKNREAEYSNLFSALKEISNPILGICFGFQIIGIIYGAKLSSMKDMDNKKRSIKQLNNSILFKDVDDLTLFQENHREEITLPDAFIQIATSEKCEIEAMEHKEKPVFGVQFHPEASGKMGEKLINNFCGIAEKR